MTPKAEGQDADDHDTGGRASDDNRPVWIMQAECTALIGTSAGQAPSHRMHTPFECTAVKYASLLPAARCTLGQRNAALLRRPDLCVHHAHILHYPC